MWGYLKNNFFVGLPRNGLGQLKIITAGTITHIFFEVRSFLRAVEWGGTNKPTADSIREYFEEVKNEEVRKIMTAGAKVLFTIAAEGTIIYTPLGWIVLEMGEGNLPIRILPN